MVNVTYDRTSGAELIKETNRYLIFPLAPLGICMDSSQQLAKAYERFGYDMFYLFDLSYLEAHAKLIGYAVSKGTVFVKVEDLVENAKAGV